MSFDKVTAFIPACDGCGSACWEDSETGAPHFATKQAARRQLADLYEWRITQQINGRFSMLCGGCAEIDDAHNCERNGHRWYTAELDPSAPAPARPVELCRRCSSVRRDHLPLDKPPAGSPESMTELLSDDDEALLSEIDDYTWPEDADVAYARDALQRIFPGEAM